MVTEIKRCLLLGRKAMTNPDSILKSFIGRTDAEVEAPILWPHDAKSQLN